MDVEADRQAGGFRLDQHLSEDATSRALDQILDQQAAVQFLARSSLDCRRRHFVLLAGELDVPVSNRLAGASFYNCALGFVLGLPANERLDLVPEGDDQRILLAVGRHLLPCYCRRELELSAGQGFRNGGEFACPASIAQTERSSLAEMS